MSFLRLNLSLVRLSVESDSSSAAAAAAAAAAALTPLDDEVRAYERMRTSAHVKLPIAT